jgi:hypothetical protein
VNVVMQSLRPDLADSGLSQSIQKESELKIVTRQLKARVVLSQKCQPKQVVGYHWIITRRYTACAKLQDYGKYTVFTKVN